MRLALGLAALLVAAAPLSGCFGRDGVDDDEDVASTGDPPPTGSADEDMDDAEDGDDADADGELAPKPPVTTPLPPPPMVVVAHIDTGVNPYHVIFRDTSPLALQHPSTYIPGYPQDAKPLNLTFTMASFDAAVDADEAVWDATQANQLYYVPGTRIVGMIRPCTPDTTPVLGGGCEDVRLRPDPGNDGLFDGRHYGHGTMTASRSVGPDSLAPTARFV
ncbi:MAG: hypothetical protein ACRDH5_06115, partial [bacterium]